MKKTTAIICAYNEEKTIRKVVESVAKSIEIDEIIVVNDGSNDNTKRIIENIRIDKNLVDIHLKQNKGKGFAMATGVEYTSNEIILFVDADLSNISETHINQLVKPIIFNTSDMVLGQASQTLINHNINPFKYFSGERSLLKSEILPIIDKMKESRFGVETLINLYFQSKDLRVKYVILNGLKHPTKFEKTNLKNAANEFIIEGKEIILTAFKNKNLVSKIIKNTI